MATIPERLGIDPSLHDLWGQLDADTQAATALAAICHHGHGYDLGRDRRLTLRWWSEFLPERVTLSAMTSGTLQEFTADLSRRLKGQIGSYYPARGEADRLLWHELVGLPAERQRKILDILETQASVCVTLIRADADARKQRRANGAENAQAAEDPGSDTSGSAGGPTPEPDPFAADRIPADAGAAADAAHAAL